MMILYVIIYAYFFTKFYLIKTYLHSLKDNGNAFDISIEKVKYKME